MTDAARITRWVQSACTVVPASRYGGTAVAGDGPMATAQTLYECGPGR
jgi:hypothetical protein